MNQAIKAALLSAFVFPGVGHLMLKRYISAGFLASTSAILIYFIATIMIDRTMKIVEEIQVNNTPTDLASIVQLVSQQAVNTDASSLNNASFALFIFWAFAILDAYRAGSKHRT